MVTKMTAEEKENEEAECMLTPQKRKNWMETTTFNLEKVHCGKANANPHVQPRESKTWKKSMKTNTSNPDKTDITSKKMRNDNGYGTSNQRRQNLPEINEHHYFQPKEGSDVFCMLRYLRYNYRCRKIVQHDINTHVTLAWISRVGTTVKNLFPGNPLKTTLVEEGRTQWMTRGS